MDIVPIQPATGTRRFVRALATSQGFHWSGIRAADDSAEILALQAEHDRVSDEYFKRADDELAIALDMRDWRLIHNHIRTSQNLRYEGYRHEALEDERRDQVQAHLAEIQEANLAGSRTCDAVLRIDSVCSHGEAA